VRIDIDIHKPISEIFLHGKQLHVSRARLVDAHGGEQNLRYEQVDPSGVARLAAKSKLAPQHAKLLIDYDAALNRQLEGLYRVDVGHEAYAFTQFEATSARLAFPGFDEPRFKTPFSISMIVPARLKALANTRQIAEEQLPNGQKRIRFAPTLPLPTYLVAMAVGDFDIVTWQEIPASTVREKPIPLRGIAIKGQGGKLTQALAKTTGLLLTLEKYFGIAYPYDKLDIVAVPDFAAGAMENAGLITYRDSLLLMGDHAPVWQHRASASVQAHEMAHQWFGDLVTMPWWDDIWLNEAFATWMGHWAVQHWKPEYHFDRDMLSQSMGAFSADSLVSARQIRQPIESFNDISSAFDGITYSKGGGVLAMFESFLGPENFREAISYHLDRFRFGTATVNDLMDSLASKVNNGSEIRKAFESFLFQPGLPFVDVAVDCKNPVATLTLNQSRYLPTGSTGSTAQSWDIPMCVRYGVGHGSAKACFIASGVVDTHPLPGGQCPSWVMPNANGAGYYRWHMADTQMTALKNASAKLNVREQMSLADSLEAGFENGSIGSEQLLEQLPGLANSSVRQVATAPMSNWRFIARYLLPRGQMGAARKYAQSLYQDRIGELDINANAGGTQQDTDLALLHNRLIEFLSLDARQRGLRKAMRAKGLAYLGFDSDHHIHPEVIRSDWIGTALSVASEDEGNAFFDALVTHFKATRNPLLRGNLIRAIARNTTPELRGKIQALVMDPALRSNEIVALLAGHMARGENETDDWQWLQQNYEALIKRLPTGHQRRLIFATSRFCSRERASEVEAFFRPHAQGLDGGPRALSNSIERIKLCAALVDTQRASAEAYFSKLDS